MRAVAALRHQFGGHAVKSAAGPSGAPGRARVDRASGTGSTPSPAGSQCTCAVSRSPTSGRGRRPSSTSTPGITVLVGPERGRARPTSSRRPGYLATLGSHRVATDAPLIRRGAEQAVVRGHGGAPRPGAGRRAGDHRRAGQPGAGEPGAGQAARRRWGSCARCCSRRRTSRWCAATRASAAGSSTTCSSRAAAVRRRCAPTTTGCSGSARRCSRPRTARPLGDLAHPRRLGRPPRPHGAALLAGRLELVAALAPPAVEAFAEVAPSSEPIALDYRCSIDRDAGAEMPRTVAELEPALLEALRRVRRQEVERGVCLVGPHRDDLELRAGRRAREGVREPRRVVGAGARAAARVLPAAAATTTSSRC